MATCPLEDRMTHARKVGVGFALLAACGMLAGCGLDDGDVFAGTFGEAIHDRATEIAEGDEADGGDFLLALLAAADLSDVVDWHVSTGETGPATSASGARQVDQVPQGELDRGLEMRAIRASSSPDPAPEVDPNASSDGAASCESDEVSLFGQCVSTEALAGWSRNGFSSPDPAPESPPGDDD